VKYSVYVLSVVSVLSLTDSPVEAGQSRGQASSPTFAKDVAPIIFAKCASCHRPGEVAPMPLLTYDNVRPWAKAIRGKVISREMPPWGADARYGQFANDLSLTREQIATIVAWIDAGGPKGEDRDMPPPPTFATGWIHGTPDYVLEMPKPYPIPAEGELPGLNFWVPVPFKEDRFTRLLEFRPGNRSVVHHGTNHVGSIPEGARVDDMGELILADGTRENESAGQRRGEDLSDITLLINYVPGRAALPVRSDDVGWRIPAGKYVRFNLHYQPSGRPETDQSRLGLWFTGRREVQELYKMRVGSPLPSTADPSEFYYVEGAPRSRQQAQWPPLGPYAENYTVVGVTAIVEPITLFGLAPHMHLRGKDMTWYLTLPEGRTETLLSVPKYDFQWQLFYELQQPRRVPAGSTITNVAHYDNSPKNRYNPAPDRAVFWSEQSWDEMYTPSIMYTIDSERPNARSSKSQNDRQ
jgi:hypothetical protein